MSFKEKNIAVSLANFTLILIFYLFSIWQMIQNGSFTSENVFRLWGGIIFLAIIVTIVATILTHIVTTIIEAIITGDENLEVSDLEDDTGQAD